MEVLAWNSAATVLLADFGAMALQDRNIARWLFLDPSTRTKYPDTADVGSPSAEKLQILLSWNSRPSDRRPHTERGRADDPDRRRSSG